MKLCVDLNADLGEGAAGESELLRCVTSASICCGLHAGDPASIHRSLCAARQARVAIGAHPSLADRENFGRREIPIVPAEVEPLITYQLGALASLAQIAGARVRHVKPHGALYNMAARDAALADALVRSIARFDPELILFAPPHSELAYSGTAAGLRVAHEFFADRNYLADGSLVPRSHPHALLHDADEAAERVIHMLRYAIVRSIEGIDVRLEADSICLHGDSSEAVAFGRRLRERLAAANVALAAPFSE